MSTGLVSLTDAASRLHGLGDKVDRSTLSRYVTRHAAALSPQRSGRETLVNFEALRTHRLENVRLDAKPFAQARVKSDSQARKLDADARLRELELFREVEKITPVAEVAEGARAAVAALQSALDLAVNETAEKIAFETGSEERSIRPALRRVARRAMESFAEAMKAYGEELPSVLPQGADARASHEGA